MKILGIIPARYASTRFPGKPLIDINGKMMIQRVYEQAKKCKSLSDVVVATDDKRIFDAVKKFGGLVIMTSSKHPSGTDRCYEALKKIGEKKYAAVINIQGDEPFIQPSQISKLAACFINKKTEIATLAKKIETQDELENPSAVKVVIAKNKEALYFSRTTIPHYRGKEIKEWLQSYSYYKHMGIYGYRSDIIKEITKLKPSSLERAEALEQLRWMENGYKIRVEITTIESQAIDTPQDLKKIAH